MLVGAKRAGIWSLRVERRLWLTPIPTFPFQGRAIAYAASGGCARTRPRGSRRVASGAPHHEGLLLCRNTRRHPEEPAKGGRLEGWPQGAFLPNAIALPFRGKEKRQTRSVIRDGASTGEKAPDCAEPVIGPRIRATRWLHRGYASASAYDGARFGLRRRSSSHTPAGDIPPASRSCAGGRRG